MIDFSQTVGKQYFNTAKSSFSALIVEDEAQSLNLLSNLLKINGYKSIGAKKSSTAIKRVIKYPSAIGTVLIDVILKNDKMDGIDTANEIFLINPELPIHFVTAYANSPKVHEKAKSLNLPNIDWIDKPLIDHNKEKLFNHLNTDYSILALIEKTKHFFNKTEELEIQVPNFIESHNLHKKVYYPHFREFVLRYRAIIGVNETSEIFTQQLNFAFFDHHKSQFDDTLENKYVAIIDGKLIDFFDQEIHAVNYSIHHYNRTDILIEKLGEKTSEPLKLRRPIFHQ